MILLVDLKAGRGGGQVVLEELVARLSVTGSRIGLVVSESNRTSMRIPAHVSCFEKIEDVKQSLRVGDPILIVSNANSTLPTVVNSAWTLKRAGFAVSTYAIVHNYARDILRSGVTRFYLSRIDRVIVVEPGLTKLYKGAVVPPWLSLPGDDDSIRLPPSPISFGSVKAYGRPDRSKGLDLLPAVFGELTRLGLKCEVALGSSLDGNRRYELRLRDSLGPWLVDGRRDASWLEAGDIFMVMSTYGEAACLAAQEVMARGAIVVASRIGLMSYISPSARGMHTFAIRDTAAATNIVLSRVAQSPEAYDSECRESSRTIMARSGHWYRWVTRDLTSVHSEMDPSEPVTLEGPRF